MRETEEKPTSEEVQPSIIGYFLRRRLIPLTAAFCVGIVLADVAALPREYFYLWLVPFFLGFLALWYSENPKLTMLLIFCCTLFAGASWYALRTTPLPNDVSHYISDLPAEITGLVVDKRGRPKRTSALTVRCLRLRTLEGERQVSGLTMVYPRLEPEAEPGDVVRCVGTVQAPLEPSNWGQFSYPAYLKEHGIHSVFFASWVKAEKGKSVAEVNTEGKRGFLSHFQNFFSGRGWLRGEQWITGMAAKAQVLIRQRLDATLPPHNRQLVTTLLCSLLFGNRSYPVPASLEEDFRRSGTVHILVVSGTQVSLIASLILLMARRSPLPLWAGSLLACGLLAVYVVIVGGAPSVLRAALMTAVAAGARIFSREFDLYNAWSFSLLALLVINPGSLFDVGLQLSYLATFGIIALAPWAIRAMRAVPPSVSAIMAASLGSQVMVIPALSYYFHRFPAVSPISNLIVVPMVGVLLVMGGIGLIFSFIWLPLARLLGLVIAPMLELLVKMVSCFARWPWAGIEQVSLSLPAVALCYAILFSLPLLFSASFRQLITRERVALLVALAGVCGAVWLVARPTAEQLSITTLHVERGFSAVVKTPRQHAILIDGGGPARGTWNAGETVILPFLLKEGISKLEAVVVTDSDHDHCAGLVPVLQQVEVKRLILPARGGIPSSSFDRMLHAASQRKVEVRRSLTLGRLNLAEDVKMTTGSAEGEEPEALLLSYGGFRFLWATNADRRPLRRIPDAGEGKLVLFLPVEAKYAPEFEEAVAKGRIAVIVMSPRSRYDQLDEQMRTIFYGAGIKVYRTDVDGAVQISTDGSRLRIRSFKE